MKYLILLLLSFGLFEAKAQITVDSYPIELKVDIDKIDEVQPITAKSTCGEVTVSVKELTFSGGCLGNLVRTYTFTDGCGNTQTAQQFLVLQDFQAPVFDEIPATISADSSNIPAKPEVKVTDNSHAEIDVTYTEERKEDRLIRIWVAKDQCGNSAVMKQEVRFSEL
jgi:hypothetical protein